MKEIALTLLLSISVYITGSFSGNPVYQNLSVRKTIAELIRQAQKNNASDAAKWFGKTVYHCEDWAKYAEQDRNLQIIENPSNTNINHRNLMTVAMYSLQQHAQIERNQEAISFFGSQAYTAFVAAGYRQDAEI